MTPGLMHWRRARAAWPLLVGLAGLTGGGCAAGPELQVLSIDASFYATAYDAAVEAARALGMPPTLRDRRAGLIETQASIAGSILEPWRSIQDTPGQVIENTLSFQRRRARFEFTPVGFTPPPDDQAAPAGPDVLGVTGPMPDLTAATGELELRVWVYIERSHAPGIRRSTWTRSRTSRTLIPDPANPADVLPAVFWSPVARDPRMEQHLLRRVRDALTRAGATADTPRRAPTPAPSSS